MTSQAQRGGSAVFSLSRSHILVWVVLASCRGADGQVPVAADRVAEAAARFHEPAGGRSLSCDFHPVAPRLSFALRFETGYEFRFPLAQFDELPHDITILLKISLLSPTGNPVFLTDHAKVVGAPGINTRAQRVGQFGIEDGHYDIEALASDDIGRTCRAGWKTEVKKSPAPRSRRADVDLATTTVFLDASATIPEPVALPAQDVALLANTLTALTSRFRPNPVRLVIFNLDQEAEILRLDSYANSDVGRVVDVLSALRLGTVSIQTLKESIGAAAFLTALIRREVDEKHPTGSIIFLGPHTRSAESAAKQLPSGLPLTLPEMFYLQYDDHRHSVPWDLPSLVRSQSSSDYSGAEYPDPVIQSPVRLQQQSSLPLYDVIERIMRQMGGHTMVFSTPEGFANALGRVESVNRPFR